MDKKTEYRIQETGDRMLKAEIRKLWYQVVDIRIAG